MKKRDLENSLRKMAKDSGLAIQRVGGSKQDKFLIGSQIFVVPRHREINELTAQAIIQDLQKYLAELEGESNV